MPRTQLLIFIGTLGLATVLALSCGEDTPSGVTEITAAPALVTPAAGATVDNSNPTLTVTNVTGLTGATYHFQVANDSGFTSLAAEGRGIAQGGGGQTSWQVATALANDSYFWRARAESGSTSGPFAQPAEFTVNAGGFDTDTPINGLLVYDPLTNGRTVGVRGGGQFTPQGWQVTSRSDYIQYAVPTLESGFVEWDNTNMEDEVLEKQWMLFGMWDPSAGAYRENPYRVNLQKLDSGHNSPYFRVRWITNGEQHDFGNDFEEWNLFETYTIRVEWGPGIGSQVVKVYLDGVEQFQQSYVNIYRPATHWIELGVRDRKESIVGIIYSNVRIGPR